MQSSIRILVALAAVAICAQSAPAFSSAFSPGSITAIAPDDALNIRKWPSAQSQIIDAYELNRPISMTGRCKNIITNVSFRIDQGGSAGWNYSRMKKAHVWCQVMTDDAELGWARGKYIWPE